MKSTFYSLAAVAIGAAEVSAHATFQQLWINGVDYGSQCIRLPQSNTPVTNVMSNDFRCNVGGARGVGAKCDVKAGDKITVEMHQVCFTVAAPNHRRATTLLYLLRPV